MIYNYIDNYNGNIKIKGINARELCSKVTDEITEIIVKEGLTIPDDATLIIVHGVLRGNTEIIQQAIERNIPWMYMDNAMHYFPNMYKRVILNATAPITLNRGKRFEHNIKLEPWRGGKGNKIIVLPPSPPYMDAFGCRDFLNYIAHNVNQYTDKEIVIRAKPAKGKKAPNWDEQLKDAYAVITWGSALALDAMIKGIPTISLGWCPAKHASFTIQDLASPELLKREPRRMETVDNLTWSCFTRGELPSAFEQVLLNSRMRPL